MTWLATRQLRASAIVAGIALAVVAAFVGGTQRHLAHLYDASGLTSCHGAVCGDLANDFLAGPASKYVLFYLVGLWMVVLAPVLIGMFWGAPLVARELEHGTSQLAWTQSVTRARWLAVKLAVTGLLAVGVTEALALMYGWWAAPVVSAARLDPPPTPVPFGMSPLAFEVHGILPMGYAVFTFSVGVAAGLLTKRSVPAMAVALGVFLVVQIAAPHLVPSDRTAVPVSAAAKPDLLARPGPSGKPVISGIVARAVPGHPGAWIASSGPVDRHGDAVGRLPAACGPSSASGGSGPDDLGRCLTGHGISLEIRYLPPSRYWPMQVIETALLAALALLVSGICLRRI